MKSKSGSAFARAKNRFYFRPTGRDARGEKTGGRTDRAISPHVDRSFQSCKQNLATLESWQARLSSQTNQLKTGGGRNFGVASASRCHSCLRAAIGSTFSGLCADTHKCADDIVDFHPQNNPYSREMLLRSVLMVFTITSLARAQTWMPAGPAPLASGGREHNVSGDYRNCGSSNGHE